ncbi:ABC transporter ATP-binding protein [Thermosulfurimonas sp.]|uniref:ABC transporter ATP-binding protein n=1 Tax=Thermosulfurimonas sp. TaxID=2080236 RepID=UPI0025D32469|nr:ABC transporter ATP-binding protein [Thermosulfurimonas sp.]
MKILAVRDLTYRYPGGKDPALCGVSLTVQEGEMVLLAGETGCGKSTLLSVLCGLIPGAAGGEFSGEVEVLGQRWPVSPGALFPRVAVVFQNPMEMLLAETVAGEVAFGPENLGLSPAEIHSRVEKALSEVGLSGFESRRLEELSGGERQRVALAAALAVNPRLLLLDEPLAQLDPEASRRVMHILRKLTRKGMTVILAEHRLDLALPWVDRVCFLEEGRVIFEGPARDFRPPERHLPRPGISSPGEVLIEVQGLSFSRPGGREVFKNLHLRFRQGERVALCGPNGSGKTTFLHLLAGLLRPSRGRIEIRARKGKDALLLGLLLQDPDLMLVRESVEAELAFAPENLGLSPEEIKRRVLSVAERLGLLSFLSRVPFSLSRGQRLRVALGALLTGAPRILLLDEPTTAQDARHMARLISSLSADLLLFSTHDEEVARALATRVLYFRNGTVEEIQP